MNDLSFVALPGKISFAMLVPDQLREFDRATDTPRDFSPLAARG